MHMNSSVHQIRARSPQNASRTRDFDPPFVGHKLPFVGRYGPGNRPFVGRFIPSTRIRKKSGFTLIELLVVLAVVAILVTLALPGFRNFIQDMRLSSQANDLIGDLSFARSEAVKRADDVVVCISTSANNCTGGANWGVGYFIFVDGAGSMLADGAWTGPPADVALRYRESLSGGNTLTANASVPNPLVFSPRGTTNVAGGALGEFRLCDSRGNTKGKAIPISPAGQVRVDRNNPPASC